MIYIGNSVYHERAFSFIYISPLLLVQKYQLPPTTVWQLAHRQSILKSLTDARVVRVQILGSHKL